MTDEPMGNSLSMPEPDADADMPTPRPTQGYADHARRSGRLKSRRSGDKRFFAPSSYPTSSGSIPPSSHTTPARIKMKLSGTALAASGLLVASASSALAAPAASSSSSASTVNAAGALQASDRPRFISPSASARWSSVRATSCLNGPTNRKHPAEQVRTPLGRCIQQGTSSTGNRPHQRPVRQHLVATVTGGTPSKDYEVVLDTGSSRFWIASDYYQPQLEQHFPEPFHRIQRTIWLGTGGRL